MFYHVICEYDSLFTLSKVSNNIVFDDTNFRYSVYNNEEGVMGLAPTASPGSELFMEVLKKRGIIDVLAFNIDYRYFGSKYSMTFGGIDTEVVKTWNSFSVNALNTR